MQTSVLPVSIRPYRTTDKTRCAEIYVAARRAAFHWVRAERFALGDFIHDTVDEEITVAEVETPNAGAGLIGFVSVFQPEHFIHHLYIDPAFRRHGIGRALTRQVVDLARGPWRLKCVVANEPALAFYRSEGWVEEGGGVDFMGPYMSLRYDPKTDTKGD